MREMIRLLLLSQVDGGHAEAGGSLTVEVGAVLLGLLAAAIVILRGCAKPDALAGSPRRLESLGMLDFPITFALYLLGGMAFQLAAMRFFTLDQETGRFLFNTDKQFAVFSVAGQLATYLPGLVYVLYRCGTMPDGLLKFGLLPRQAGREVVAGVLSFFVAVAMVMGLNALMVLLSEMFSINVPEVGHVLLEKLQQSKSWEVPLLLGIGAILIAPVCEEIFFRGVIQTVMLNAFNGRYRWAVVLFAGALFALVHLSAAAWQTIPGLFLLGVILGWLYEKRGSLWPPIIVHMLFNAFNFGMVLLGMDV